MSPSEREVTATTPASVPEEQGTNSRGRSRASSPNPQGNVPDGHPSRPSTVNPMGPRRLSSSPRSLPSGSPLIMPMMSPQMYMLNQSLSMRRPSSTSGQGSPLPLGQRALPDLPGQGYGQPQPQRHPLPVGHSPRVRPSASHYAAANAADWAARRPPVPSTVGPQPSPRPMGDLDSPGKDSARSAGTGQTGSAAAPTTKGKGRAKAPAMASPAAGAPDKRPVMMRARRKERKTPARPFTTTEPMIPILDTMSPEELADARAHNTRIAAERKENERRRNNQSAKRARIRKMATAVALGDEILRLRGQLSRAQAEAALWRDTAYQRNSPSMPPPLPPWGSETAMNPLGPAPQVGQDPLEKHYEDEVRDMRRCLREYVTGGDLAEICTQEFHDEIAAVLQRGDDVREGLPDRMRQEVDAVEAGFAPAGGQGSERDGGTQAEEEEGDQDQ